MYNCNICLQLILLFIALTYIYSCIFDCFDSASKSTHHGHADNWWYSLQVYWPSYMHFPCCQFRFAIFSRQHRLILCRFSAKLSFIQFILLLIIVALSNILWYLLYHEKSKIVWRGWVHRPGNFHVLNHFFYFVPSI